LSELRGSTNNKLKIGFEQSVTKHSFSVDYYANVLRITVRELKFNFLKVSEMQARWLTQLIVKNKHLPTKSEMVLEIEKDQVGLFFLRINLFFD
jgi:hypothetical protein